MIIYNPHNERIISERIKQAEEILNKIPAKYCFITGSFLYKDKFRDIDIFVVTRSKKKFTINNKKAKITIIDFNDLYSLFYHSISKSCIAKNILPRKPLKVTMTDYWGIINEGIPDLMNQKNKFHKEVRFLILYTEYFRTGEVMDTYQLNQKIDWFKNYNEILSYIKKELPKIINKGKKRSYLKRYFYSWAGIYKNLLQYNAQKFLYELTHQIANG